MFVIDTIIYSSFRQEITNVTETGGGKKSFIRKFKINHLLNILKPFHHICVLV